MSSSCRTVRRTYYLRSPSTSTFPSVLTHVVHDADEAGDKICLFGFSRGAYTARALAGMLHKVGLLPAHNNQQVPFAYKMYMRTDELGWKQSTAFKKAFSIDVDIDFIGVWSVTFIHLPMPYILHASADAHHFVLYYALRASNRTGTRYARSGSSRNVFRSRRPTRPSARSGTRCRSTSVAQSSRRTITTVRRSGRASRERTRVTCRSPTCAARARAPGSRARARLTSRCHRRACWRS